MLSILLAGMMVFSSIPVYAEDDIAAYADISDGGSQEEATEQSETAEADITEEDAFSDAAGESEDTTASSGTLATGVKWELSEDGKLTFSASGMIEKDDDQDYPWDKSKVASVTIKEGITGIGSKAFASCTNLTEIRVAADTLQTVSGVTVTKEHIYTKICLYIHKKRDYNKTRNCNYQKGDISVYKEKENSYYNGSNSDTCYYSRLF